MMLGRGARGYLSAECLARWTCVAVLLEFLIFSTGLVSSTQTVEDDQIYSVGESLNRITEAQVHDIPKCLRYPASPELQSSKELLVRTSSGPALNGFQILVRKMVAALRVAYRIQYGIAKGGVIIRPASGTARGSGARRLLLKGFGGTTLSSSRRYVCPPAAQSHPKERLMMEETTATLAGEQTQQVSLGPPAPKGLVQNEKQDWNQDYAEPDVHPPSSN